MIHPMWTPPMADPTPLALPRGLANAPVECKVHWGRDPDLLGSLIQPQPQYSPGRLEALNKYLFTRQTKIYQFPTG